MIVVLEGIDRVGKTTLANKLKENGFVYLKDEFVLPKAFVQDFKEYSVGKCDSFVALIRELNAKGKNVVVDRLHLTEMVYGQVKRSGQVNEQACLALDMELAKMGAYLCYVKPSDIELSNKLAGCNQEKLNDMFEFYFKLSSMKKVVCDYENIDNAVSYILGQTCVYDFYFASPFFNPEQVEREERMIAHLRSLGFIVFSPKESCFLDSKAEQQSREDVFKSNCDAINNSKAVFAVTDGKDMGTIWEAGYAYGINKPVIYYAETLGSNKFNLMLAQSGKDVYTNQSEVTYNSLVDAMTGVKRNYRGDIE